MGRKSGKYDILKPRRKSVLMEKEWIFVLNAVYRLKNIATEFGNIETSDEQF